MKSAQTIPATPSTVEARIWEILSDIPDPEIPVLSILELGIVRAVKSATDDARKTIWKIYITPTYSGCPAFDVISMEVKMKLAENGFNNVAIINQLASAWTTDWMTETGKQKLEAFGISPPGKAGETETVTCPHCKSQNTELISAFSSTACKALYRCIDCDEPFDHFKCH